MARKMNARPFSASSQPAARNSAPKSKRKLDPSNAYTYLPASTRMAELSESEDERPGRRRRTGSEDDEDDMAARVRKLAMMIAAEDAGGVEDDDDEDIASDDAWEQDGSDEERWGDVFRDLRRGKKAGDVKGKSKGKERVVKPAKPILVNLEESEGEEPAATGKAAARIEADSDEYDDGDADEDREDEDEDDEVDDDGGTDSGLELGESGEDEEDDDDDDDEAALSDPALPSDLSDDDDDNDEFDGLGAFVDQLASADRAKQPAAPGKKRRVLPVADAPALDGAATLQSYQRLDLSSLIASHPSLASASSLLPSKADAKVSSVLKAGVLAAPLPTTAQARLDREAAYGATRDEAAKWSTLMKRVKEAEHLSFPLQAAAPRGGTKSAGEVLNTFAPRAGHESAVHALLAQANLTDAGVAAAEDAALRGQDLSADEIASRRAELRHQRELMFRAEARAKRVSKIKSKTFRKLARKRDARDAEKNGISAEDLERLDPEAAEEARQEAERQRAKERATLRHGAKNGRWARDQGGEDVEGTRRAKEEMLDLKARLSRKIQGVGSGSESESGSGSEGSDDDDEDAIKSRAFDQLARLDKASADDAGKGKGLANMAFMKKAEEREMKRVREDEAAFRRELEGAADASEDDDGIDVMKLGEGRMVFAGPTAQAQSALVAPAAAAARASPSPEPAAATPFGAANPWLDPTAHSGPSRKRQSAAVSAEAKAVRALKKAKRGKAPSDDELELELDVAPGPTPAKGKRAQVAAPDDAQDEDGAREELMPVAHGVTQFAQRELVAEAFAGDNVVADFAAEKQRVVEADAPNVQDTTLPGWGAWGGQGVRPRKPNARYLKTTAGVLPTQRADAGKANVIVSERRDKKAAQFLAKDLPYPYTSVAQYEKSFDAPVGAEWNSRAGFQRGTVPRVVKKPGAIIEPVRKLF
ncbi:hypothetical protein Q5752_002764 [Cryptotrichosporon argae]